MAPLPSDSIDPSGATEPYDPLQRFGQMGLTFDDVCLVPSASDVIPAQVSTNTHADPRHRTGDPADVGGDGHRHRGPPGHRHGPRGRPGRHPPQPVDRGPGHRGRQGQALRVRHDRRPGHARARRPGRRCARPDVQVPHLRRADRRRAAPTGGHPHQPRPALRGRPEPPRARGHDRRGSRHRAHRHHPGGCPDHPGSPPDREAAGGRRRRPHHRAHHRQGHQQEAQVPQRHQGRPGSAALRRCGRRRRRRAGARAGARRVGSGPDRGRHGPRALRRRARGGHQDQGQPVGGRGGRQHRHRRRSPGADRRRRRCGQGRRRTGLDLHHAHRRRCRRAAADRDPRVLGRRGSPRRRADRRRRRALLRRHRQGDRCGRRRGHGRFACSPASTRPPARSSCPRASGTRPTGAWGRSAP